MPTRTTNTPECRALANNIATNLKVRRLAKGLTQAEVADAVGVNLESFSRVERGLSLPSFPTLLALAALYGATPGELLESPTTATARTPPRARIRHNRERPGSGAADDGELFLRLIDAARSLSTSDLAMLVQQAESLAGAVATP